MHRPGRVFGILGVVSCLTLSAAGCQLTGGCAEQSISVENLSGVDVEIELTRTQTASFEATGERWSVATDERVHIGVGESCGDTAWHPNSELPPLNIRELPDGAFKALDISEWVVSGNQWTGRVRDADR